MTPSFSLDFAVQCILCVSSQDPPKVVLDAMQVPGGTVDFVQAFSSRGILTYWVGSLDFNFLMNISWGF